MKKIISIFLLFNFLGVLAMPALAYDDLPALPNLPAFDSVQAPEGMDVFSPSSTPAKVAPIQKPAAPVVQNTKPVTKPAQTAQKQVTKPIQPKQAVTAKPTDTTKNSYAKNNLKNSYVFPSGRKFKVRLGENISDKTPTGANVTFKTTYPETSRYITIPAGTTFKGKVSDSHAPTITGNGGLIVINVDRMVYNGKTYEVDAKVSVANGKHIFFNNIKGKRMYFQSIPKSMKPGSNFFKKMWRVTCNLAKNESGVEIILTPFSLITGTLVYAVNFVTSPVLAIFYKGKSITIPKDSQFTIQLRNDILL